MVPLSHQQRRPLPHQDRRLPSADFRRRNHRQAWRHLLADIDGGLVIPRKIAVAVLERAEQIERNEGEIKEWVAAGLTAEEIHDRGGYF